MLKGHVFAKQTFGNPIFALFMDIFLQGKCGIANYKENFKVTYSSNMLTVLSGAACIRGRFVEEDNYTNITVGQENGFCKLVIEVNLDNINTETDFTQGSYKILKNSSAYPTLTQTDIVKNNSGVYQFELAKFKVGSTGIIDFQDTREYIDLENLYKEYKTELDKIKNNEGVVLKDNFAVISGSVILEANQSSASDYTPTEISLLYPEGFNKDNCVCISCGTKRFMDDDRYGFNYGTGHISSTEFLIGEIPHRVSLNNTEIKCTIKNPIDNSYKLYYKIVLLKI